MKKYPRIGSTYTVVYGNDNYVFNAPVTILAPDTMPHYKKLTSLLKVNGVDRVHLVKDKDK